MNTNGFHENNTPNTHVFEHNPAVVRDQLNKEKVIPTQEQVPDVVNDSLEAGISALTESNEGQTSDKPENDKKQVKRVKKRKCQNAKKCKFEKNGVGEEGAEKEHCNGEYTLPFHSQPVSRGESLLNSSILDEILSEKKRILLESAEMTEFLRSRIKP